jgi:hypothetical protein
MINLINFCIIIIIIVTLSKVYGDSGADDQHTAEERDGDGYVLISLVDVLFDELLQLAVYGRLHFHCVLAICPEVQTNTLSGFEVGHAP